MTGILLKGARLVSMSPQRPDTETADIHIVDDCIAAIGTNLGANDAEVVDVSGRVVVPGLINAHLHTWQTALRYVGVDWSLPEYLATAHGEIARHYRPTDIQIGTLAGALTQIDSGVTSIADWSHNCETYEHAESALDGLFTAGIRAVFFHGAPHGLLDRPHDINTVDRLLSGPIGDSALVSLGMAVKGPQQSKPDVAVADLRNAADRGVLASMHQSLGAPGPGWQAVTDAGLWGPRINIVHGTGLTAEMIQTLADAGVTFTATPENELGQGHTTNLTQLLLHARSAPSLGTDTEIVTSPDLLSAARMMLALQRDVQHREEFGRSGRGAMTTALTAKHALSWITVEGARALGLSDQVGYLDIGMQADLVIVDTRDLNLWPAHDAIGSVLNAHPGNIEAVMIAGQWRKREHRLLVGDIEHIKEQVLTSGRRLVAHIRQPSRLDQIRRGVVRHVVRRQFNASHLRPMTP